MVTYPDEDKQYFSSRADKTLAHKYIGMPISLAIMRLIFRTTFTWIGTPLPDQLDTFIGGTFTDNVKTTMNYLGVIPLLQDLITDSIIAGVGSVLVFVPQVVVLSFFIFLLEDSGYMVCITALMDRIMESSGLGGKFFISMVTGFGCNVPSIMAAHSIENGKERLTTILIAPFMSCSARLSVYAPFVGIFFKENQSLIALSLYILGIIMAFLVSTILIKIVLKNDNAIFTVELPIYRVPSIKTLWCSTQEKVRSFVRKAGTFIFGGSVVIWLLSYVGPHDIDMNANQSFLHMVGSSFGMLAQPLGFRTWQAGATLVPGSLTKEVIVGSAAIIYSSDDAGLVNVIQDQLTSLLACALMIFILLYIPCVSTVAAIRKKTYSWKQMALAVAYPLVIAYVLTPIFYQVGHLFI